MKKVNTFSHKNHTIAEFRKNQIGTLQIWLHTFLKTISSKKAVR